MALLETYNINAMATQISREFYINENNHAAVSYTHLDVYKRQ